MDRVDWRGILLGAAVAAAISFTTSSLLPPAPLDSVVDPVTSIAIIFGVAAYFLGGYIAGRIAGRRGGLNGIIVVVIGYVLEIVAELLTSVVTNANGTVPEQSANAANAIGLWIVIVGSLFLPFLAGYAGGKLGERSVAS